MDASCPSEPADPSGLAPRTRLGDRVVLRHLLADGSATDVVGWLESVDAEAARVRDHAGALVTVPRARIVAARRAPAARGGRDPMRTSPAELEQIAVSGWAAETEELGEWTLRAGGGFTGRANSCLAVGDPGVSLAEAAERIVAFADARGARPWAQVVDGSAEARGLAGLGWREVYVPTDVLVCRLSELLERAPGDPRVEVAAELGPAWLAAYHRSRPAAVEPAVLRRILEGRPPRAFAGVGAADRLIAIGRGHLREDWLGLASLYTDPDHRRRGWATRVMAALGHWAARQGARSVYLQVAAGNRDAAQAYERLGFRRHHGYHYLAAPGS